MAIGFQNFAKSQQRSTPDLIQAEIARAKMANQAQQAKQARFSQNLIGGGMLYNQAMGDKSPIADYMSDALRGDPVEAAVPQMLDPASAAAEPTADVSELFGPGFEAGGELGEAALPSAVEGLAPAADVGGSVPLISALRGGQQLAEGDLLGAAGTGGKAWMSALGPWGMGGAALLSLLGI